jgi:hypothetical protein
MEIELPELREVPVVFPPDFGGRHGQPRSVPVHGEISLGEPVVQAIDAELAGDDVALRAFVADQAPAWRFQVVFLGATFLPGDGAHFGKAWLTVRMTRDDGAAAPPAIAWSLTPQRSQRAIERPRSVRIGAGLVFDASVEVASSGKRNEVFVDTYGLQAPVCSWEFTRTSMDEIRGTQRLALVARIPKDATITGTVEVRGTIVRKRLGVLPYRIPLDSHIRLSFSLPPT